MNRVLDPLLHTPDGLAGVALVPTPVEVFGDGAELDDEVAGQILWVRPPLVSRARAGPGPPWSSPMMIRASDPPMNARRSL